MEKTVLKTFFVLLILIGLPFTAYTEDKQGPQLVLQERTFDFGQVKEGKRIIHAFTILNQGDAVLRIHKVSHG